MRGHFCRRKILDYNERKKYLNKVKKTNEETLMKLEEYAKAIEYDLEVINYNIRDKKRKKREITCIYLHLIYIIWFLQKIYQEYIILLI